MKPEDVAFFVAGHPATFATAGEKPWRLLLEQRTPRPSMDGREVGMTMRLILPSLAPQGQHLDTDNLCEPVFSVIVNRVGWFRGGRPNITWWQASKAEGSPTGCEIVVTSDGIPSVPADTPIIEGIYTGPLPRNAKEPDVANWARGLLSAQGVLPASPGYCCYLGFASSRTNIGDVATGVVKSFVDCLYPILGGSPGSPADHRIAQLTVVKDLDLGSPGAVILKLWPAGESAAPRARTVSAVSVSVAERKERSVMPPANPFASRGEAIANPCRPGSAKHIVCEAALAGRTTEQTRRELDASKPGSSRNLSDYVSDLRSENGLDIVNDGSRLSCRGRIRK